MPESPPERLTAALWSTNLAVALSGLEAWAAAVDVRMAEARRRGAELLIMPEYASAQWLSFAPPDLPAAEEIAWMAEQAPAALEAIAGLPEKHGMALLAGSMPWAVGASSRDAASAVVNRAWLLLPDGRWYAQDKLCLTPSEQDGDGWRLGTGRWIQLVRWQGLTLATLICLDVELPALAARLGRYRPDILLVPSMTTWLSGHHRVHSCARARAVELQAAVLTVGCIGDAATGRPRDGNTGGAGVYVPSEPELGHVGILAEMAPAAEALDGGPMLIATLPLGTLRRLRAGAAEVWPGEWRGEHVEIRPDDGTGGAGSGEET